VTLERLAFGSRDANKLSQCAEPFRNDIEAALLPHVFERFRQGTGAGGVGGLGLGLATVRHLVELHAVLFTLKAPAWTEGLLSS
jgi:hypothetical protein